MWQQEELDIHDCHYLKQNGGLEMGIVMLEIQSSGHPPPHIVLQNCAYINSSVENLFQQ